MIDINKQYRTRDGRKVRIYATDGMPPTHEVHGAIKNPKGWSPSSWTADGRYAGRATETDYDLIEVKPRVKMERWVNVYFGGTTSTYVFKEDADKCANHNRIACVKIEIDCEEGEGL